MYKNVNLCLLSPGMMRTDLLLKNVPKELKHILEIVAEDPEYVASTLAMIIENKYEEDLIYPKNNQVKLIRFFDVKRMLIRFLSRN